MKVRVRHIDESQSVPFTECRYDELVELIGLIKQSAGFYWEPAGDAMPFHSYQLVLTESGAYAEILIGEEDE